MEISVFGATGYIASAFCKHSDNVCLPIDRESREPLSDEVLYCLSTSHEHWMLEDVHHDIDTNLSILVDVLEAWTKRKPRGVFNYVSTWFVYGDVPLPAREEASCNPIGFYSVTKYAAERLVETWCRVHDLRYRILRPVNVCGGRDAGASAKKYALQWLCDEMAANRDIKLYYDGQFVRDYIHITDVVVAFDLCLRLAPDNMIINVGRGEPVTFRWLIEQAAGYLGSSAQIRAWGSPAAPRFHRTVQAKDFWADTGRLRSMGFKPKISMETAIDDICDYSKQRGNQ